MRRLRIADCGFGLQVHGLCCRMPARKKGLQIEIRDCTSRNPQSAIRNGMSFLAPAAFAFAAAIPVVIVFYLLKRKRVVKLVSSTLLWQRFLAETQASAPFQKLRHNWLLILQLMLLALVVFSLARPYFATKAKPAQLRVIVLDASASM